MRHAQVGALIVLFVQTLLARVTSAFSISVHIKEEAIASAEGNRSGRI